MDPRIALVVDGDEITSVLVEKVLNASYQVIRVAEGKRAVALVRKGMIEFAVIARCLPDINGLDVMKILLQQYPELPVLFIADSPTKNLIVTAFRTGAKDFLEKPLEPDLLSESIQRLLASRDSDEHANRTLPDSATSRFSGQFWLRLFKRFFSKSKAGEFPKDLSLDERMPPAAVSRRHDRLTVQGTKSEVDDDPVSLQMTSPSPQLVVSCLGKFQVLLDGQPLENWTGRKGKTLFAYLTMNHTRQIYRDVLMETFWPNSDPSSARNSLNVAIHSIRRLLHDVNPEQNYILFRDECYCVNPDLEIWVDVKEFLHNWKLAQSLEREQGLQASICEYEMAAALYKGDFMEEDLYENWPAVERENFKEIYLFILDRLSKYYSLEGKLTTAISLCEAILEKDNCREEVHRRIMRCYYKMGQRDKAVRQFRKCVEILKQELDVVPTRTTIDLYHQIKHDLVRPEETPPI